MPTWLSPIVSQSRSYVLACYSVKKPLRGNIAANVKSDFKRKVSWDVFFSKVASNNGFGKGNGVGLEMLQSTRN